MWRNGLTSLSSDFNYMTCKHLMFWFNWTKVVFKYKDEYNQVTKYRHDAFRFDLYLYLLTSEFRGKNLFWHLWRDLGWLVSLRQQYNHCHCWWSTHKFFFWVLMASKAKQLLLKLVSINSGIVLISLFCITSNGSKIKPCPQCYPTKYTAGGNQNSLITARSDMNLEDFAI